MPLIKYSIFKNSAIAAENEVINDSIGSVSFITKAQAKINLANLSNKENKELKTPRNQSFVDTKDLETNNTDCFYKHFSERSVYKDEKTKETITPPSSNVYKIQLEDNTIFALEIRNNDPLYIIGLDISTYLILQSIAVSTAEIETIKTLIENNNFPKSPTYYFLYGNIVTVENNGERPYYKVNLGISGSEVNTVTGKNQVQQLDTGIVLYSFDKNNWISSDYAEAAFNIITGYVWDNKIIPNPIEVNPFAAYWTGENGLKERLNTIITEANNLPIANDNKGARLLDTPIRDYIYQGDIEKVTFEMAFRLPFYMEDIKKTPYTKLTNGRDNNPYYTKFDDWFGYANGLRTSAGKTLLNEAGKITTNYNDDYHDYNKEFQDLLIVKPQNKREYYVQKLVSAFIAKNFEYENANYIDIAHIPYPQGSIKKQGGARDLTVLVNSAIISQDTKTKLENESIKYAKITDGTYTGEEITNAYVSKSKGSFYIYTYTWNETTNKPNSSGLTFGFGYDIGQNKSLDNFNDYTG
ncbi:MAG: hypothetical protein LBK03_04295, partial [Bacteroidales bacterium]|nr:hypothetical protein [Bacteroidales bacterium]